MTAPLPPLSPGVVIVAPASPKAGAYGEGAPSLIPGQAIYFRVLPAQASGEVRLRIGAHTLTAAGQRPLPEGASGTAVVRSPGPPIVLQITELRAAAAPEPLRLPVLTGRVSLGAAASLPQAFLAKWNQALKGNMSPDAAGASPDRFREGILLSRAVVSALVVHAGGEVVLKRLTGMRRSAPDGPAGAAPRIPGRPIAPEDLSAREMSAAPVGPGRPSPAGTAPPSSAAASDRTALAPRPDDGTAHLHDGPTADAGIGTADGREDTAAVRREFPDGVHVGADDAPFWFFIPFPGEKTPVLFPGYRRRSRGEKDASWNVFLRLPDLGAVNVRFQPGAGGWRIEFGVEHEGFARALIEGSAGFAETLRARAFPVREVVVRRVPGGEMESQVVAALSSDLGLPLVERRA